MLFEGAFFFYSNHCLEHNITTKNVCEINTFTVIPSGVNQTHGRSILDLMREWLDGRCSEMEGPQVLDVLL